MDTQKEGVVEEGRGCCGFGHHKHFHGFCFIRFAVLLAILTVVFVIGLAFGKEGAWRHYRNDGYGYEGRGGWGMMDGRFFGGGFRGCGAWLNNANIQAPANTATNTPATNK